MDLLFIIHNTTYYIVGTWVLSAWPLYHVTIILTVVTIRQQSDGGVVFQFHLLNYNPMYRSFLLFLCTCHSYSISQSPSRSQDLGYLQLRSLVVAKWLCTVIVTVFYAVGQLGFQQRNCDFDIGISVGRSVCERFTHFVELVWLWETCWITHPW